MRGNHLDEYILSELLLLADLQHWYADLCSGEGLSLIFYCGGEHISRAGTLNRSKDKNNT
jgi:hypothetical protein